MRYNKAGKVSIKPTIIKKIQRVRRELMKKYNVVKFKLTAHGNAKKVINFKSEWKKVLLGIKGENGGILEIKNYWKEYAVTFKDAPRENFKNT